MELPKNVAHWKRRNDVALSMLSYSTTFFFDTLHLTFQGENKPIKEAIADIAIKHVTTFLYDVLYVWPQMSKSKIFKVQVTIVSRSPGLHRNRIYKSQKMSHFVTLNLHSTCSLGTTMKNGREYPTFTPVDVIEKIRYQNPKFRVRY